MARSASGTSPTIGPPRGLARATTPWQLLLVILAAGLALWRPALIEDQVESRLVDLRFRARNAYRPPPVPPGVIIVAVDEPSIARFGSWPWHPSRIAELIEKVGQGEPLAVGIEPSLRAQQSAWGNQRITEALASLGQRAVSGLGFERGGPFATREPPWLLAAAISRVDQPSRLRPLEASRLLPSHEAAGAVSPAGHANYETDGRGVVRRERLYLRCGDAWIPSLALQVARVAAGLAPEAVRIRGDGALELGATLLPADRGGRLSINYYGGEGSLPRHSAGSILARDTDLTVLKGAVVFIGTTGIAAYDLVGTPFADSLPAVERSATVAANILARDFLRDAPPALNLLLVLAAGAAVPLLCRRRSAALSLLSLIGLALLLAAGGMAFFLRGLNLALTYPLLLVLATGGPTVTRQYLAELGAARTMRRLFSSYVTERVVERLIADPAMARLGGERREVTILFADIRGFTSFSEKHPPEEVVAILNQYLGAMTEVVFRWEGTLDKFIGDTILAFWGAPLPQPDHAERALRCALHLCSRLDRLNAAWAAAGRPALEIGIGVTTGTVLVGNIGAEGKKMDYTVIGDQVNLCSRVEELTKSHGARILIAASTYARLRPRFAAGAFGHLVVERPMQVAVKGREEAVGICRVTPREQGAAADIAVGQAARER